MSDAPTVLIRSRVWVTGQLARAVPVEWGAVASWRSVRAVAEVTTLAALGAVSVNPSDVRAAVAGIKYLASSVGSFSRIVYAGATGLVDYGSLAARVLASAGPSRVWVTEPRGLVSPASRAAVAAWVRVVGAVEVTTLAAFSAVAVSPSEARAAVAGTRQLVALAASRLVYVTDLVPEMIDFICDEAGIPFGDETGNFITTHN